MIYYNNLNGCFCIKEYSSSVKNNILVGGYGGNVKTIDNKDIYNITNASWMLKLNNNILMNDEHNSILYLIDSSNKTTLKTYPLQQLNTPVYFYLYNNIVYIACYGDGSGNKAGILTCDTNLGNVKEYVIANQSVNHIHCIDLFSYTDSSGYTKTCLIAVNLGDHNLYKIDPTNINFNTIVYTFPQKNGLDTNPRHFIQIPNTNKIVVITEEFNTELALLDYDGSKFNLVTTYNLKQINPYITGAEIKYHNGTIYCTIRTYVSEFKDPYPYPDASNGIFAKFTIDNNIFTLISKVTVGKNPRYFTIYDNTAYITNQESKNVMTVDIGTMGITKKYPIDNSCSFILL